MAQRPLKRTGIGRVYLDRQVHDPLHGLHGGLEHRRLVQPRHAYVYVEKLRTRLRLRHGLAQDVGGIPLRQGRLELLLASGVDALAYDHGVVQRNHHGMRARRHCAKSSCAACPLRRPACETAVDGLDMRRRRSAASAYDGRACVDKGGDLVGEILGAYGEDGLAVHDLRHARVGFDYDRQARRPHETPHVRQHAVGAQSAVEAQRVDAQALQQRRDAFGVAARKQFAVLAQRDGGEDGKSTVLLGGEDCGL